MPNHQAQSTLTVRVERVEAGNREHTFSGPFRIGRDSTCELQIDSDLVSRFHAEVTWDGAAWIIRDLGSRNGILQAGAKVSEVRLDRPSAIELGNTGPLLTFTASTPGATQGSPGGTAGAADPSVSQVIGRYFEESDEPAGERTMMIRQAYKTVAKKQKRRYGWIIATVLVLAVSAVGYGLFQRSRTAQLRDAVAEMFYVLKQTDLEIAQLAQGIEEHGGTTLRTQLSQIRAQRDAQAERYDGLVRDLGLYRRLTEEEQYIYNVARVFNESQLDIPADFVEEVKEVIHDFWLTNRGRKDFIEAVETAEDNEYVEEIVDEFRRHGLPPQFFYLALQESKYDIHARGPETRWGRAKGMWQFIPTTARRYDLFVPQLDEDSDVIVEEDERHDFEKSTKAAAEYLQEIYVTLAQASGLLVMASYNWGEHRIVHRLEDLPGFEAGDESLPENPRSRTYWNFLNEYEEQMPEETKDYVLKIFAAAVIGEDPRFFGFEMDNPLARYVARDEGS